MIKLSRNDLCWCGSGQKYKKCHLELDQKLIKLSKEGYLVPPRRLLLSAKDIEGVRKAGKVTHDVLDIVGNIIKPGVSTEEINILVHNTTIEKGAIPAPLNYSGFPKSVCTSINEVVCHGIPSEDRILKDGDIINVDVTSILDGYYGDASRMYLVGNVDKKGKEIIEIAKECLYKGIEQVKPFATVGDIGYAINEYAVSKGYSVVREYGGHGIGKKFHEDPFIDHVGRKGEGMVLVPGMIFTIEPMINEGTFRCRVLKDNWTAVTADGKLSAQWEHTLVVTETGYEILT
ncbi:type I methionyl aminopeptidase [Clostridium sp. DL1XJH146]